MVILGLVKVMPQLTGVKCVPGEKMSPVGALQQMLIKYSGRAPPSLWILDHATAYVGRTLIKIESKIIGHRKEQLLPWFSH
jgi:hypothetical protein